MPIPIKTTKNWIVRTETALFRVLKNTELAVMELGPKNVLVSFGKDQAAWVKIETLKERTDFDKTALDAVGEAVIV